MQSPPEQHQPLPEKQNAPLDGRASKILCACVSRCQFRVSTCSVVPREPAHFCLLKAGEPNCNSFKDYEGLALSRPILSAAKESHCEYRRLAVTLQALCGPLNRAPHGTFNSTWR